MQFSFEFFPVRTPAGEEQLAETIARLASLQPLFGSMTYGAGGSGCEASDRGLKMLLATPGIDPTAHITIVGKWMHSCDPGWTSACGVSLLCAGTCRICGGHTRRILKAIRTPRNW